MGEPTTRPPDPSLMGGGAVPGSGTATSPFMTHPNLQGSSPAAGMAVNGFPTGGPQQFDGLLSKFGSKLQSPQFATMLQQFLGRM